MLYMGGGNPLKLFFSAISLCFVSQKGKIGFENKVYKCTNLKN